MHCPYCGFTDTIVKNSRAVDNGHAIRRRRACEQCHARFSTVERLQVRDLVVSKRNGTREVFERDKLARSIYTALRKRPVPMEKVEQMIADLVRRIELSNDTEISTQDIGALTSQALLRLDRVAYIRFASVYHAFDDPKDFETLIKKINQKNRESA